MKINPDYFSGSVSLRPISGTPKPKEAAALHVTFRNGARTKLHRHTSGQMLIVTAGSGSLVTYSRSGRGGVPFKVKAKETLRLRKGSVAYIPAGTIHTHGSVKKNAVFSHIAMNFAGARGVFNTTWYESDKSGYAVRVIR